MLLLVVSLSSQKAVMHFFLRLEMARSERQPCTHGNSGQSGNFLQLLETFFTSLQNNPSPQSISSEHNTLMISTNNERRIAVFIVAIVSGYCFVPLSPSSSSLQTRSKEVSPPHAHTRTHIAFTCSYRARQERSTTKARQGARLRTSQYRSRENGRRTTASVIFL